MAKRDDWKTKDFPSEFSTVRLNKILSEEEFRQAEKGLIPRAMEDKWFIFFENGWFYMHRSWSGFCIYKIRVNADGANYLLDELFINRNKEQYNTADDEYDKLLAAYLFDRLLLSRNVPFPTPSGVADSKTPIFRHSIIGDGRTSGEM